MEVYEKQTICTRGVIETRYCTLQMQSTGNPIAVHSSVVGITHATEVAVSDCAVLVALYDNESLVAEVLMHGCDGHMWESDEYNLWLDWDDMVLYQTE